jgi:hypothetical protein
MEGEETTVAAGRKEEKEGLGGRFYLGLTGLLLGVGILVFIAVVIFWRALYAWGFFGAFLALAVILLVVGRVYDRRNPRRSL